MPSFAFTFSKFDFTSGFKCSPFNLSLEGKTFSDKAELDMEKYVQESTEENVGDKITLLEERISLSFFAIRKPFQDSTRFTRFSITVYTAFHVGVSAWRRTYGRPSSPAFTIAGSSGMEPR